MLRAAAGLGEVGQVLRHASLHHLHLRKSRPDRAAGLGPAVAGEHIMSQLRRALEDYLVIRRALGYKLRRAGLLLADFVAFQEAPKAPRRSPSTPPWPGPPCRPTGHRTGGDIGSQVRTFARHLHAIDPSHQVPPPGLLPAHPSGHALPVFRR